MENLETGKDKIKHICQILKDETLEPAKIEASQIIESAKEQALHILKKAESKAESMIVEAKGKIANERELFSHSLNLAARQAIEVLKQDIEKRLFNRSLSEWLSEGTSDPNLCAQLIKVLVEAVEKEGVSVDFSALVPQKIPAEQVNRLLAKSILEKLREKQVVVGDFSGGVALKLHDKHLVLDMSDQALKELLGQYIRKDFREHLFEA